MNEIDYSDKSEWKKFVSDYIIPLGDSARALANYWNYLREEIDRVSFNEIETEKDKNFKKILLGGVKEDGDYSERSLALFYSKFFGVQLSNLQEYLISQREGVTSQVTGAVEESEFMKFVRSISEETKVILESAYQNGLTDAADSETSEIDFVEFIKEPEKVAELIKGFYNIALRITVNYNQHTLFLWTIRKITRKYLEAAYQELSEEEKFGALKSIVGLEKYFEPEIEEKTENDKKVKREYTIWHLPEKSFGGLVCRLNESFWGYFEKESFRGDLEFLFAGVVDLKKDFKEKAGRTINNWKFPEYIEKGYLHASNKYAISGIIISEHRLSVYTNYGHPWSGYGGTGPGTVRARWLTESKKCNIPLLTLFDDLSPALFLGVIDPAEFNIRENILELKQLGRN